MVSYPEPPIRQSDQIESYRNLLDPAEPIRSDPTNANQQNLSVGPR
jgi:hypothetical protein